MKNLFVGYIGTFFVSKKCTTIFDGTDNIVTGSPSDIRKVCRILRRGGYYNLYENAPIMREGRIYSVRFPETPSVGNREYVVSRKF